MAYLYLSWFGGSLVSSSSGSRLPVDSEIHLRRLTVDDALFKLDRYLNDAFMTGLCQVRIIHGKGTGILRQAIRKQLENHSLVKSCRPGDYREGGAGVTIVELVHR